MPTQYLLHVFSIPDKVDDSVWTKWYTEEHVSDMVYCGVSKTGQVYAKVANPIGMDPPDEKRYFAAYQSDSPQQLDCKEYREIVRHDSGLWGFAVGAHKIGTFDIRNYKFLKQYNPKELNDMAPPFILHLELSPEDEADLWAWAKEELQLRLDKLPGFRRSLYYKAGIMERGSPGANVAPFVIVIDLDSFEGLSPGFLEGQGMANFLSRAKEFNSRTFKLLGADPENHRPPAFTNPPYNPPVPRDRSAEIGGPKEGS